MKMNSLTTTSSVTDSTKEDRLNDFKTYCTKFNFFASDPSDPTIKRCQVQGCASFFKWKAGSGYSTMGRHLVVCHRHLLLEAVSGMKRNRGALITVEPGQATIPTFYAYASDDAKNIAGWIELILFENYPLDSCEKRRHPHLAKFVTLKSMSRNTTCFFCTKKL